MLSRRFKAVVALGMFLPLALACAGASIRHITGPDGSPMLHVSCGDQGECYQLAGTECPLGYDLYPVSSSGRENFLVRCRLSAPQAVAMAPTQAAAPIARAPVTPEPAPNQWPPADETSSLQQPWPQSLQASATSGAAADSDAGAAPPIGSIDIGY